jgi:hypothetical protein
MPAINLASTLRTLKQRIDEATKLVSRIQQLQQTHRAKSYISKTHHEMIIELSFLRSFIAWETFLEQSFILYLLGKKSPKGYAPKRYVLPQNYKHAMEISLSGQPYADWTAVDVVIRRAERFFKKGEPFASLLKLRMAQLNDIKIVRNAITHSSIYSKEQFRKLVRRELSFYPPDLTPGGFLNTGTPNLRSRIFLEHYLDVILESAGAIVR